MGMEVCTTLGMLSPEQAKQLKEAYVFFISQVRLNSLLFGIAASLHTIIILIRRVNFTRRFAIYCVLELLPASFSGHHDAVIRRTPGHD